MENRSRTLERKLILMTITSDTAIVNAPINSVFEFLAQPANIEKLLPADKISDFTSDEHGCMFKVQGGFSISLVYADQHAPTLIRMKSGAKAPFDYQLAIHLEEKENATSGYLLFNGEVNMFLKMMVEKPLIGLFNYMSRKLQDQFQ